MSQEWQSQGIRERVGQPKRTLYTGAGKRGFRKENSGEKKKKPKQPTPQTKLMITEII